MYLVIVQQELARWQNMLVFSGSRGDALYNRYRMHAVTIVVDSSLLKQIAQDASKVALGSADKPPCVFKAEVR